MTAGTTKWVITTEGFAHRAGRMLELTMQSVERPSELDAARPLVIEAKKLQGLVPAGQPGASAIDRLRDYNLSITGMIRVGWKVRQTVLMSSRPFQ